LPYDKLFGLINEARVFQELLQVLDGKLSEDDLRSHAGKICSATTYKDHKENCLKTSSRCIFAILTLLNKVHSVPEFIDAELSDKYLPLGHDRTYAKTQFFSLSYPTAQWSVAGDWSMRDIDLFETYQNWMLSPFFELKSAEVPFYDLYDTAVLPFIEDSENDQKSRPRQGHHGNVWRIKIHPAHHDLVGIAILPL